METNLSKETHCLECGGVFNGAATLCSHIAQKHMSVRDYYDKWCKKDEKEGKCLQCGNPTDFKNFTLGYERFCSVRCAKQHQHAHGVETTYTCKECGESFTGKDTNVAAVKFGVHIKNAHQLSAQQYYDKHLKKEGEGICKVCGQPTAFLKMSKGYASYCSRTCHLKVAHEGVRKYNEEIKAYREEETKIVKTQEMLDAEWQKEIAERLAEFEGDRETSYHAESEIQGSFGVQTTWLY